MKPSDRGIFQRPPNSGIYWIRYLDAERHDRIERIGTSIREARRRREELVVAARAERAQREVSSTPSPPADPLLSDVITVYLSTVHHLRDFSRQQLFGQRWSAVFASRTIASILPGEVEAWRSARLAEGLSAATTNRHIAFLQRVFEVAVDNDVLPRNIVRRVKMLRENNERVRFLDIDEELRLYRASPARLWTLVQFAFLTGLRLSEQLGLTWKKIDLANRIITIPRSKHGEHRRIPISDKILAILSALPSRAAGHVHVFISTGSSRAIPGSKLARGGWVWKEWQKTLAAADPPLENFHWHDLRHTFASRLVMSGVDLVTVQQLMGHKSISTTMRYAHLSAHHLRSAVNLLQTVTETVTDEAETLQQ